MFYTISQESWFAEAIEEEPDVFVLVGHMPVSYDNWPVVFDAIRAVHPLTPILIFGGHTHIRDCQQYDGRSMALESGRYMETIGWMSANLSAAQGNSNHISSLEDTSIKTELHISITLGHRIQRSTRHMVTRSRLVWKTLQNNSIFPIYTVMLLRIIP